MTGRGAGWCAGNDAPGIAIQGSGRGLGMGFGRRGGRGGRGRGWRHMFFATGRPGWARSRTVVGGPSAEAEVADLRAEASWLDQSLNAVKARIAALAQPGSTSDE